MKKRPGNSEHKKTAPGVADKDLLTTADIQNDVRNMDINRHKRAALETNDGKNNGAEPAVFKGEQKYHP